MDDLTRMLGEPLYLLIGVGAAALVLVLVLLARRKKGRTEPRIDPQLQRLLDRGEFEAAARMEGKNGNLEMALECYLRAGKPEQAARVARQMGQPRKAAELYEKCGDHREAELMYRQAGMDQKADEMAEALRATAQTLDLDDPGDDLLTPLEQVERQLQPFEELVQQARGDEDARRRLQQMGQEMAETLMAAGEPRRAAEICRDAGLLDQAINLFVNLLADPGSAAPLLAERGEHERAAELYEAAGQRERALAAWVDWSDKAEDPLSRLEQVQKLGDDAVCTLLDSITQRRPPSVENVAMHLTIAGAFERCKRPDSALRLLKRLSRIDSESKQIQEELGRLRVVVARAADDQLPNAALEAVDTGDLELDLELPSPSEQEGATVEVPDLATAARLYDLNLGDGEEDAASPAMKRLVRDVAARAAQETVARVQQNQVVTLAAPGAGERPGGGPGLEASLRYAHDQVVEQARQGPGVKELQSRIARQGGEPDIRLLYQLGLARQVAGQWKEARGAFEAVAQARPEYGDAAERARELGQWEKQVPLSMMETGPDDGVQQRYRLLGELGRGGMAVVFRAQDEVLGREVALKFISEEVVAQQMVMEMFQREARASAQLNHPNIVTVHDVGTLNGRTFICMELVQGKPLDDMIANHGRLTVIDTLQIAEKILCALEYAHAKQIIHRDIKPSNIICGDHELVKLMDFGLAKSIADGAKTTVIAGTPDYMAPEQFTGKNVNASTDLFALGATMYEMLTGSSPFQGVQRDRPAPPVRELNSKVPNVLDQLIQRTLEFDQARRLAEATAMLGPVRKILTSVTAFMQKHAMQQTLVSRRTSASLPPVGAPAVKSGARTAALPGAGRAPGAAAAPSPGPSARPPARHESLDDLAGQDGKVGPSGTILHGVKRKR